MIFRMTADTDLYTGSTPITVVHFTATAEYIGTHDSDAGAGRCNEADPSALVWILINRLAYAKFQITPKRNDLLATGLRLRHASASELQKKVQSLSNQESIALHRITVFNTEFLDT